MPIKTPTLRLKVLCSSWPPNSGKIAGLFQEKDFYSMSKEGSIMMWCVCELILYTLIFEEKLQNLKGFSDFKRLPGVSNKNHCFFSRNHLNKLEIKI